jgi:hypothetical protein
VIASSVSGVCNPESAPPTFDYKKRRVSYFGSPDTVMEFTTWNNTYRPLLAGARSHAE